MENARNSPEPLSYPDEGLIIGAADNTSSCNRTRKANNLVTYQKKPNTLAQVAPTHKYSYITWMPKLLNSSKIPQKHTKTCKYP